MSMGTPITSDAPTDWASLRVREFPGSRINLNAGTLGTSPRSVRVAQREFWRGGLRAWPLGQYQRGRAATRRVRELAGRLWGASNLAVTGGASEAMTRLTLALHARLAPGPIHVLASGHEHAGGINGFLRHPGFTLSYLPAETLTCPAALAAHVAEHRPHVLLLSQVTYTTGLMLPIAGHLAAVRAARPDLWVIIDAAQAVGLVPPAITDADAVVASGHKWLFGPPGSGLVWLNERALHELGPGAAGEPLDPESPCAAFERVGGHDFSVHAGLAAALELHEALGPAAVIGRSRDLAAWFAAELHARLRDRAVHHLFFDSTTGVAKDTPPPADRLIGSVHVQFPALDPYPAYAALDARGIHFKCIKDLRTDGTRLAVLRACIPCYETHTRLRRALDLLTAVLVGAT